MKNKLLLILCLVFVFSSVDYKIIDVFIGETQFIVEVSDTPEKRIRGLMFRDNIPDNYGMLFVYPGEEIRSFWMKNCRIHLDVIYLNSKKQIIDMYINVPPCTAEPCPSYVSRKKARYVLELRGNRAAELKLKEGDSVFFVLS